MWFVYVLECSDGSFYTGYSDDPKKRLLEHQLGKGGRYTRSHKPIRIVYQEQLPSKSEALKREFEIKSWSRKKKINLLKLSSMPG